MNRKILFIVLMASLFFTSLIFVGNVEAKRAIYNFTSPVNKTAFNLNTTDITPPMPWGSGWAGSNETNGCYVNLTSSNNINCSNILSGGAGDEPYIRFNITLNEKNTTINWITAYARFGGKAGATGEGCTFYLANFTGASWTNVTYTHTLTAEARLNLTTNAEASKFIDNSGNFTILIAGNNQDNVAEGCQVDWVNVTVDWNEFRRPTQDIDLSEKIETKTTTAAVAQTFRPNVTQSLDIAESSSKLNSFVRGQTDSLILTAPSFGASGLIKQSKQSITAAERIPSTPIGFSKFLTDDLDITDRIQRIFTRVSLITNALDLTDAITSSLVRVRQLTNAIDLTESVTSPLTRIRELTQALDLTDNIQLIFTRVRLVTDAIDLTETTGRLLSFVRSLTNAIILAENGLRIAVAAQTFSRTITQALDLVDSITASLTRLKQVTAVLSLNDNIQSVLTRIRLLTNSISLTETFTRLVSFTRSLTNGVDLTDVIQASITRLRQLTQAIDLTDSLTSTLGRLRTVTNPIDLTDAITRLASFTRNLTDAIDLTELIERFRILPKNIIQSLNLTENIQSILTRARLVTNAIELTDNMETFLIRVRLLTNAINLTDTVTRLAFFTRSLTNAIDLTDAIQASVGRLRQVTNAVDITEAVTSTLGRFRVVTNAVDLTETVSRLASFTRNLTNTIDLRDAITRLASFTRNLTDAIDLTELTIRLASFTRALTNAINLTEIIERIRIVPRSITNALDITDSITTVLTRVRLVTNSIDVTEVITRLFSFTRTLTNSIDLTDVTTRLSSLQRSIINTFTLTDRVTTLAVQSFSRIVTQSLDITDNIQTFLIRVRQITNAVDLSEATTRLASFVRSLTNTVGLTDAIQASVGRLRQVTNAVDITEAVTSTLGRFRQATQSLDLTESIQTFLTRVREVTNAVDLTETVERLVSFTRSLTNAVDLTELTTRLLSFVRSLTNTVGLTDAITSSLTRLRELTDGVNLTDAVQTTLTRLRLTTQAVDVTELIQTSITRLRQLTQSLEFNETITRIFSPLRLVTNAVGLTENIQALFTRTLFITNAIDITDTVQRIFSPIRQISEAIDLTDTMQRIFSPLRQVTNAVTLSDIAVRLTTFNRMLTNIIDLQDAVGRLASLQRLVTETFDLTELQSKFSLFRRITSLQIFVTPVTFPSFKTVSATFTMPATSVVQGEFVEFDFNIKNTGNENLNVSTGTDIFNSTHFITSVNSSSTSLSKEQSKTIVTFLNTINLSADNYRAEGRVLFDGRSTINITKLFNIAASTNIQTGTFTNTSVNITADTPVMIIVNTSISTITNISIVLNSTQQGGISVAEFSSVQNQTVAGQTKLKFIDIKVSPNITNAIRWYWLNISYTDAQVSAAGVAESNFRIWFYNTTTSGWQQEGDSGVETDLNYVWANVSHFSLFGIFAATPSAPAAPSTGAPSAPSGSAVPLPTANIEFVKWPVLREVVSGQSTVESIKVRNKGETVMSNLHIKVSGVPADWVDASPKSINLLPKESKTFNLVISVPKDSTPGDYKLLVTLENSNVEDSTFIIVRVKSYSPAYNLPTITRLIELDYGANNTRVSLDVNNQIKYIPLLQVQEDIPKSLAQSVREIEFDPYPDEVIRDDPLVQWDIKEFQVNESRRWSYLTKGILDEFTAYIYYPLKELTVVETRLPTGLKFIDINIQHLSPGKSSIGRITIENIGDVERKLGFSMHLPSGWMMEPEKVVAIIQPKEKKEIGFSIVVPDDAAEGDYIGTAIILWGDGTHIKETVMQVSQPVPYLAVILAIGGISLAGSVAYMIHRSLKKRERVVEYNLRKIATVIRRAEAAPKAPTAEKEVAVIEKMSGELVEDVKEKLKHEVMQKLKKQLEEEMKGPLHQRGD